MACDEGPATMVPFVMLLPTRWFWNVRLEWLPFFSIGLWLFSFGVLRGCTHDHPRPAARTCLGCVVLEDDDGTTFPAVIEGCPVHDVEEVGK
jgi:hypothetical protein